MYIETLSTPNPILYPGQPAEAFVEAAGLAEAPGFIGNAPDKQAAVLEVARHIQDITAHTLHYPKTSGDYLSSPSATALESMVEHQQTSCIGFTMAGSEAFSRAGIGHFIAYANKHFFIIVPQTDEATGAVTLYSFDMLSPRLNQNLNRTIRHGTAAGIVREIADHPERQFPVMLDTSALAANVRQNVEELTNINPWLSIRDDNYNSSRKTDDPAAYKAQYSCVMAVYAAETGREVIGHYVKFRQAVALGNTAIALQHLEKLQGRYPENDCRATHSDIRDLVGKLCVEGGSREKVAGAVEQYCSSLRTDDPRAMVLKADLLRKAAVITKDPAPAREAAALYGQASVRTSPRLPRLRRTYHNKSQKMARLVNIFGKIA